MLLRPFSDRSRAVVASYMVREVLHPIFGCQCMHLLSQLTLNFDERRYTKVGRTAGAWGDITRRTNSRAPELAIYLRMYLCVSFHRSGVNSFPARSALVLHEQTRIAVTRLVWTAVILDSSETSGPLSNSRTLKLYS